MVIETSIIYCMFQTKNIVMGVVAPVKNEIAEILTYPKKNVYQRAF